jgi:hypothetical protein
VNPRKDEPLEEAYRRAVDQAKEAGGQPFEPERINTLLRSRGFGRIFNEFREDAHYLTYVCTAPWTAERTEQALNDLSSLRLPGKEIEFTGRVVVRLLSAYPVPPSLEYVFADTPRGLFENRAMAQAGISLPLTSGAAPGIGERAAGLASEVFGEQLDLSDVDTLERIDRIVHRQLRPPDAYVPHYSLISLGCAAGETMRRVPRVRAEWIRHERMTHGIGLRVGLEAGGEPVTANPIGKLYSALEEGERESIAALARTVLQTLLKGHGVP